MRSADLLAILKALKAKGVHAKLLYSRMGEVTADDGTVLPITATFAYIADGQCGRCRLRQYRGYR
ncbi:hypothetical protein ACLB1R_07975 [Escherichia coli]